MKKLNRFLPSPAMVIACVALFVAMGGSAAALATGVIDGREVKNYSLTGKDVKKDGLGGVTIKEDRLATVPSASGLQRTAVVGALGQLARGKDIASVGRTSTGRYLVTFRSNVQGCAYVASLGDPSQRPARADRSPHPAWARTRTRCRCAPGRTTVTWPTGRST